MSGYQVIERSQLPAAELEGQLYGANICVIFVDNEPGQGPRLHRHAYEETFITLEGRATFTVGSETLEVVAGQVVVVQAGMPHKFVNSGEGRLRQIDIHSSPRFVTEWLED